MFDGVDDAGLVDAMVAGAAAESIAAAGRLSAIAELVARHGEGPPDSARWSCDNWDMLAAQVAAAHHISHAKASAQMYLACALRNRLPRVQALLAAGTITVDLARTIVWHTDLIKDPAILARVDTALAADATRYGPLSAAKTATAIDALITRHDPAAARRTRTAMRGRDVIITPATNNTGTATIWGTLSALDAALLDRRLDAMARDVCGADPRTQGQRRADALGALAADGTHLACTCQAPDCPHRDRGDARAAAVIVHVVADAASAAAQPDPLHHGELPPATPEFGPHPDPEPEPLTGVGPAYLEGGYTLPAPLLAELLTAGAPTTPLNPFAHTTPEPHYRPTAALQRFIRSRDLTCRFPGCDAPAWTTDIDHTIAYPFGPTHPANLKTLCRKHHLLKTFWTGPHGWRDRQHPDGTITWTAPTGHTYTTQPGSRLLFPTLCQPTAPLPATPTPPPDTPQRTLMMPLRRRTRTQDRTYRIHTQRTLNQQHLTTTKTTRKHPTPPPPPPPPNDDDPPPF